MGKKLSARIAFVNQINPKSWFDLFFLLQKWTFYEQKGPWTEVPHLFRPPRVALASWTHFPRTPVEDFLPSLIRPCPSLTFYSGRSTSKKISSNVLNHPIFTPFQRPFSYSSNKAARTILLLVLLGPLFLPKKREPNA